MAIRLPPLSAACLAALALAAVAPAGAQVGAKGGLKELTLPPKGAATSFGAPAATPCPDYGVAGTVIDGISRAAKEKGVANLSTDGGLCAIANLLLGWKSDDLPPPDALLFLMRGAGFLATPQTVMLSTLETEEPRDISRGLAAPILEQAARGGAPRYGLATKRLAKNSTRVVMVLLDVPFTLAPLPRQLPLGGTAELSGALLGDAEKPEVVVSDPLGRMSEPPQPGPRAFQATLACGARPGRIHVVLRATQGGAVRRLASIPVACGGDPLPTSFALETQPWPTDPAQAARRAFEQLNAERTGAGLPALAWSPALASVAQELTVDLAREQRGGAPSDVRIEDRLAKVELGSPLVLQNPGQSDTARRAAEAFLESPVHRANLMNPDVNAAGVGVVLEQGPGGQPLAFINEVFIKVMPPRNPGEDRAAIRAALIQKRADLKVSAVASDPALEEVAQAYADALAAAGGRLPDAKAEAITQKITSRYKEINLAPGAVPEPLDVLKDQTLLGKSGEGLGVGVALGQSEQFGKNTPFVVIITAARRDAKPAPKPATTPAPKATPKK